MAHTNETMAPTNNTVTAAMLETIADLLLLAGYDRAADAIYAAIEPERDDVLV